AERTEVRRSQQGRGAPARAGGGAQVRGRGRRQGVRSRRRQEGVRPHQHVGPSRRPGRRSHGRVPTGSRRDPHWQHPRRARRRRMTDTRWTKALAWSLAVLVLVAFGAATWLGFARGNSHVVGMTPLTWLDVISQVPFLAFPVVGAVIVSKQQGNPVGWLFSLVGATATVGNFAIEFAAAVLVLHRDLPAGELAAWLSYWIWVPAAGLAPFIILL